MSTAGTLPNFVIVGISKAGTTTLFDELSRHPDICASSTKETRFFQSVRYGEPLGDLAEYRSYFRGCTGQPVVMECTPDYFYGAAATAAAIDEVCRPRVAVIVRDPVSRLVSFFRFQRARLQLSAEMTLADYVQRCLATPDAVMNDRASNVYTGVWGGHYDRFMPAWLDRFDGRISVWFFDDLVAAPVDLLARACTWLGVDPGRQPPPAPAASNATVAYRSPLVQRSSARLAKMARPVLHFHPALAGRARAAYQAVNERAAPAEPVPDELRAQLVELYADSVRVLRQQLLDAGVSGLPGWLRAD